MVARAPERGLRGRTDCAVLGVSGAFGSCRWVNLQVPNTEQVQAVTGEELVVQV